MLIMESKLLIETKP